MLKDFLDKMNDFEYLDEPYTILEDKKIQGSGLVFAGCRNKTNVTRLWDFQIILN